MNSTIGTLSARYANAAERQRTTAPGVYLNPVEDRLGQQFAASVALFSQDAEGLGDATVDGFLAAARMLRWAVSVEVAPFSWAGSFANDRLVEMRSMIGRLANVAGRRIASSGAVVLDVAGDLEHRSDQPMAIALLQDLAELGEGCCVVVPRGHAIATTRSWLASQGQRGVSTVLSAADVAHDLMQVWGSLLCLGTPRTYDSGERNYLSPLLAGGFSDIVSFLYPSWALSTRGPHEMRLADGPLGAIVDSDVPTLFATFTVTRPDPTKVENLLPLERLQTPVSSVDDDLVEDSELFDQLVLVQGPPVECLRIGLAMDYSYYIEADADRVSGLTFARGAAHSLSIPVSDLNVGDWLIARMDTSESEELRRLAIKILGDEAGPILDSQLAWKSRLLERGEQISWSSVEASLLTRGIGVRGQARRWATPMAIRPRSDNDFKLLLDFLGYAPIESTVAFANAKRLYSAIRIAARGLSRELLETIGDLGEADLRDGRVFEITGTEGLVRHVLIARVIEVGTDPLVVPLPLIRKAVRLRA